jgi:hypothetical protein
LNEDRSQELFKQVPYCRFQDFIAPHADRFGLLVSLLEELRFSPKVFCVAGNRHIFFSPNPNVQGYFILVAHYDRTPDSPGANDNSAAVFELIDAALRIREGHGKHSGPLIIFTDKEELSHGEGILDQGAYTLACSLRAQGFGRARVFIFDACGVGDTLIVSTAADHLMKHETGIGAAQRRHLIGRLRTQALEVVRQLNLDRVRIFPTPFSDDAGFLRAGLVAQTITVLPASEAAGFGALLRRQPDFADALLSKGVSVDRNLIPETWRLLNGPSDTFSRLTPQSFSLIRRFICGLSG